MFFGLCKGLEGQFWQYLYKAVLTLGVIACTAESFPIKQMALQRGLLYYSKFGGIDVGMLELPGEHVIASDCKWVIRSAAATALIDIYQQFKSLQLGFLARETLSLRLSLESHPFLVAQLSSSAARMPKESYLRQISFVGKYISLSKAESYLDSEIDSKYMKNYLSFLKSTTMQPKPPQARLTAKFTHVALDKDKILPFKDQDTTGSSNVRYHENYQKVQLTPGDKIGEVLNEYFAQFEKNPRPVLTISTLPKFTDQNSSSAAAKMLESGTANRRKLFNGRNPSNHLE